MSDTLFRTLDYIRSELSRIETMAGTLAMVEREHYRRLTNFDQEELLDIAVEEHSAARQLGTIKEMCLSLAQRIDGLSQSMVHVDTEEEADRAQAH